MTALTIDGLRFDAKSITSNGLQIWLAPNVTRRKLGALVGRSVPMSWVGKSGRTCHAVVRLTDVTGSGGSGGRRFVSIAYVRSLR